MSQWIWVVLAVVVLAVIGLVAFRVLRERRTRQLRTGFGPEYDRAIDQSEDRRAAETELTQRKKRRSSFDIRPLSPESRERYGDEWRQTQAHFVDEPVEAVALADKEVMQVMRERGYPVEDFDQRAADLSVDHPNVVENYRSATRSRGVPRPVRRPPKTCGWR